MNSIASVTAVIISLVTAKATVIACGNPKVSLCIDYAQGDLRVTACDDGSFCCNEGNYDCCNAGNGVHISTSQAIPSPSDSQIAPSETSSDYLSDYSSDSSTEFS